MLNRLGYSYQLIFINREEAAIRELLTVTKDTRIGGCAEGAHLHIVHLSDASSSLDLIKVYHLYHLLLIRSPGKFLIQWIYKNTRSV